MSEQHKPTADTPTEHQSLKALLQRIVTGARPNEGGLTASLRRIAADELAKL